MSRSLRQGGVFDPLGFNHSSAPILPQPRSGVRTQPTAQAVGPSGFHPQPRRGERSRWLPHPGRRVLGAPPLRQGAPPLSRSLRQGGGFDCGIRRSSGSAHPPKPRRGVRTQPTAQAVGHIRSNPSPGGAKEVAGCPIPVARFRVPHPCRVFCDRVGTLTFFAVRAGIVTSQNPCSGRSPDPPRNLPPL